MSHLPRRTDIAALAVPAAALVFALDLLWSVVGGSPGSLAFGLVDEPAHLATCLVGLLAAMAIGGFRPPLLFLGGALLASMAIDVDHIPGLLGWDGLSGTMPRPYPHSLLTVGALLGVGWAFRGDARLLAWGLAFGVAAHLFRDVATGPGVSLLWPVSDSTVALPYVVYAGALGLFAGAAALRGRFQGMRDIEPPMLGASRAGRGLAMVTAAGLLAIGVVASERAEASPVAVGVYLPGSDWNPSLLDDYANTVGRQPAIVHIYRDWSNSPFEPPVLDAITARGAVPLVTWEPWRDWSEGVSLWEIANGAEDAYIADAARAAAAWGGPLMVRFGHEMNGAWYPWGAGVNDNTPLAYRAAWRHVVGIFRSEGAGNVRWVWTPYVEGGALPFKRFYPGDRWVDWVGFDGFNWGSRFLSFAKLFHSSYRKMVKMTSKPLIIAETGSIEAGGSKPVWIRRALRHALPRYKHIRALLWWSEVHPRGMDLRLESSTEALEAWAWALQAPRFESGKSHLFATPSWLRQR